MAKFTRRRILQSFGIFTALFGNIAFMTRRSFATDLMQPPVHGEMELGNPDAKIVMVEYASASCTHCRAWHMDVFKKMKPEFIDTGKIRFLFREYPHDDAGLAAFMLARCMPKQKYFPLVDAFFEHQETWTAAPLAELRKITSQAGMTNESFDACLKNEKLAKDILSVRDVASAVGVKGVPALFINGERVDDAHNYANIKTLIEASL